MQRLILPFVLLAAVACQPGAAPLSDEDVAAIEALGQAYAAAIVAGDAAAVAAVYADDAIELPPGHPVVVGRHAIQAAYDTAFGMGQAAMEFTMTPVTIEGVDGLAYDYSTWSWAGTPPGASEPITERGRSLAIASMQEDGSWRWVVVTWNSDTPPPGSP
jgi:uncharacterized protein (TIGR02246 family)